MAETIIHALVLRRAEYGESDRMVTLFTKERGRIDAIARGCRRPRSPLMNCAEPFTCGEYRIFELKGRASITQCAITDSFYGLRSDYDRLKEGAGWLKLLELIATPEEPAPDIFDLSLIALAYLENSILSPKLLGAMFKMRLMLLAGFYPSVSACAVCGKSLENVPTAFSPSKGGCVCQGCAPGARRISEGARRVLLKAPRRPFNAVEKLSESPDWPEAAARLEEFLAYSF